MIELDAIESSTNAALLAQLAGCDETEAQDELDRIGGLKGLLEYEPGVVGRFARMRMRRVALATAMELARRLIRAPLEERVKAGSAEQVARHFAPRLAHLANEELWVAVLDGKNAIQRCCKVGMGGFHSVGVALPLILRPVIAMGAPWFVLVHNHPSNDPAPSPDDVRMTRETVAAARTIGVRLVDHVIVAPSGKYSSMLGLGVVDFET